MKSITVDAIRKDFPYLQEHYKNKQICYLDNAATTQKPQQVIDALTNYYQYANGGPHRGAHYFSMKSTEIYESTRQKVADFIGAKSQDEIVFTRGATEGLNLLAYSYGLEELKEGDEILLSIMEHHSNLCNWQYVAEKTKAKLVFIGLDENRHLDMEDFRQKLNQNTKLLSITAASNVTGEMPKVKEMIQLAKKVNPEITTVIDGSQWIPHHPGNIVDIDADFLVFSGHKMCAAMGIGVLYGKKERLNSLKPFHYGGDMIEYVDKYESTFLDAPHRFEAGTQNVGGVASLAAAIDYIQQIGFDFIKNQEKKLMDYAYDEMSKMDEIEIYSVPGDHRSPALSFNFKEVHPHDVATILNEQGIAIRSGHHCAQPLHRYLDCNFSCRVSFGFYNTIEEVDYFLEHLDDVKKVFQIGIR
ncbi:MAG: SufS family cysteine desulfurase [Tissierellia bacterium]|nr:SufS family cysteine desulfurase [Tissierellia bacterium]